MNDCHGRSASALQYDLGLRYYGGRDVKQDDAEAMKWWRKAAGKGHANALLGLGLGFGLGRRVPKDLAKAKEFFGKACNAGPQPGCDQYTYLDKSGVK